MSFRLPTCPQTRKIIRAVAKDRGCRYRITKSGEVHFYGRMPNTNEDGWYFIGWDAERVAREFVAVERCLGRL